MEDRVIKVKDIMNLIHDDEIFFVSSTTEQVLYSNDVEYDNEEELKEKIENLEVLNLESGNNCIYIYIREEDLNEDQSRSL